MNYDVNDPAIVALLETLDPLSDLDRDDYTRLPGEVYLFPDASREAITLSVLVRCDTINDWLPKSQLRVDEEGNLHLGDWLYELKAR